MSKKSVPNDVEAAQKQLETLKEKFNLQVAIDFPKYRELPDAVRLALVVIFKEDPQFIINLTKKDGSA